MFQFKFQLAASNRDRDATPFARDLGSVEVVASRRGLIGNGPQITADCRARILAGSESIQLRMKTVALGFTEQHFLGEQTFSPQCDESNAVKEGRVQRP